MPSLRYSHISVPTQAVIPAKRAPRYLFGGARAGSIDGPGARPSRESSIGDWIKSAQGRHDVEQDEAATGACPCHGPRLALADARLAGVTAWGGGKSKKRVNPAG